MVKLMDLIENKNLGHKYDYGCVYLSFRIPEIFKIQDSIDPNDLYEEPGDNYGLETKQHITLLYGFHKEIKVAQIEKIIDKFHANFSVSLKNLSLFKNDRYEVLKFDAVEDTLNQMNRELSKLSHTTDFPIYRPHLTLAYLKPKTGQKYVNKFKGLNFNEQPTGCYYSESSGKITNIFLV